MNGVRSTYKRKGYLLTALAAAVLLAASSGTAWAQEPQLEDGRNHAGGAPDDGLRARDATITVRGKANVHINAVKMVTASPMRTVTVDVAVVAATAASP